MPNFAKRCDLFGRCLIDVVVANLTNRGRVTSTHAWRTNDPAILDLCGAYRRNEGLGTGELAAALPSLTRVDLLPYHHAGTEKYQRLGKSYALPTLRPPGDDRVAAIAETLQGFGLQVQIGG